jgi:YgiT-type zinc finger domain-containing protein
VKLIKWFVVMEEGVSELQKKCNCGNTMNIRLRTVIFSNTVEIENVPIFSCDACSSSEIYSGIKADLTGLINKLGSKPQKQQLLFDDINEFAYLMYKASDKDQLKVPVELIIEERINQLLDLLILAQSLQDQPWMNDIQDRLLQITNQVITMYDFS